MITAVKLGMNNGGNAGRGCFNIEHRSYMVKVTNMHEADECESWRRELEIRDVISDLVTTFFLIFDCGTLT